MPVHPTGDWPPPAECIEDCGASRPRLWRHRLAYRPQASWRTSRLAVRRAQRAPGLPTAGQTPLVRQHRGSPNQGAGTPFTHRRRHTRPSFVLVRLPPDRQATCVRRRPLQRRSLRTQHAIVRAHPDASVERGAGFWPAAAGLTIRHRVECAASAGSTWIRAELCRSAERPDLSPLTRSR
jgi:hypothetical protein